MTTLLRQSTQIKVRVGPAVAVGDAFTPVTNLTLSGADEAELLKANGAATVDISGATFAAVTGADGWYDLTLTTSHTDTVGELLVVINDDSLILPIYVRLQVVEENVYDAWFAASGAAGTDLASILADTGTDGVVVAAASKSGYRLSATGVADVLTTAMTEAYAAAGATMNLTEFSYMVRAILGQFDINGKILTTKKIDGSTTAKTFTMDAQPPNATSLSETT